MKTTHHSVKLFAVVVVLLTHFNSANGQTFNTAFTLSDGSQSHQIAFNGLGFLSGDFCSCSFVPPGKVADYFGFQYLRDNDVTGMGHNSDFSAVIANNLLSILTTEQKALIVATAKSQVDILQLYAMNRLPLIESFVRLKDKQMPTNSPGLDSAAVKAYSAELYRTDARVCIQRAQVYASIINSFTTKQKNYLDSLVKIGGRNMPNLPLQIDQRGLNNYQFVGAMSIADDIFSWYVGNIDADAYFCPERQGNYFGSYYLKDAPAMGNSNYSIDTALSQTGGQRMLNALTVTQRSLITSLTSKQKSSMYTLVDRRTELSKLLRGYLTGAAVDTAKVIQLSEQYGELDGRISYLYATAFAKVNWTMTSAQMDTLLKIRNLDAYPCVGAYSYSDKISMPTIKNTDFLFLAPIQTGTFSLENKTGCFPNPFHHYVIILNKSENAQYELTDIRGRKIWSGTQIEKHDFTSLPIGVYFVNVLDKTTTETYKVIKN